MTRPNFLDGDQINYIQNNFGSPTYVYSEQELSDRADEFLSFPNAYGLTVRYAMKANSNRNILKLFHDKGRCFVRDSSVLGWLGEKRYE